MVRGRALDVDQAPIVTAPGYKGLDGEMAVEVAQPEAIKNHAAFVWSATDLLRIMPAFGNGGRGTSPT